MKSVIIHKDGRHIDLHGDIGPGLYAELEAIRSPRKDPVLRCGTCVAGIFLQHGRKDRKVLYGYHHHDTGCATTFEVRPSRMTDEHKNIVEYHLRSVCKEGHVANTEVTLPGHKGRPDLVINGRTVIEAQHSQIRKPAAVDRTARYIASGLESVTWFSDWATDPQWYGHVPGYKAAVPAAAWKSLPKPRTITAVGPRIIEAVRCGTRAPCGHRKPCGKWIPWTEPWRGLLVDDVALGLADGSIRPFMLGANVALLGNRSVALYAGLTGLPLDLYEPGKPKVRTPKPSAEVRCDRPPLAPVDPPSSAFADFLARSVVCSRCERYRSMDPSGLCYACRRKPP